MPVLVPVRLLTAVQRVRRLYESVRAVSVSMGRGLGFVSISEARASACVSMYSRIFATLPFRTAMSRPMIQVDVDIDFTAFNGAR